MDWEKSSHAPGQQTASWTMTHRFDVFLNNDREHPRGKFQTVSYALNAKFTPSPDNEHFFRMDRPGDKISSGWTNFGLTRIFPERAWWTGQIEPRIVPSPRSPRRPTADKLVWQGSQPESVNSETQYSSGEEFSIGFNGTGTAGNLTNVANGAGGLNLSYTTSKSKSWTIQDWGVENKGFGDDLHWLFSAAVAP